MKILEVKHLQTSFLNKGVESKVLEDINFTLNEGEVLGIVGETGSGKTITTLSMLGLLDTQSAKVSSEFIRYYQNPSTYQDLNAISEPLLRSLRAKEIAIIFQNPRVSLNPLYKCGRQLDRLLKRHLNLDTKERRQKINKLFQQVGFQNPDRIYKAYPHELSGGELQRVMIAYALVCDPKLLILDEPTSALDQIIQRQIIDLLMRIQKERSLSLIFISHNLPVLSLVADRIIHIDSGQIIESQSTEDFFLKPAHEKTKKLILELKAFQTKQIEKIIPGDLLIQASQISKTFSQNIGTRRTTYKALDDVSIEINSGERIGIIGESGSGKTTLGKCLSGLMLPKNGVIDFRLPKEKLCYIYQDASSAMDPNFTVSEIIDEVLQLREQVGAPNARKQEIIALLNAVQLSEQLLYRKPSQLSGGQRQRVNIARALATKAEIFICDEITSGLDINVQYQIMDLMLALGGSKTLVFISHDLSLISKTCQRVIVMKDGRVVEEAETNEIFAIPSHEYTRSLINSMFIVKYFLNK